jgi:hypothetical protein
VSAGRETFQNQYTAKTKAVETKLVIYPNPSEDLITVQLGSMQIEGLEVQIFNSSGSLLPLGKSTTHQGELILNIAHLSADLYILRISNRYETRTASFVKSNR